MSTPSRTAVVTGATGFIGRALIPSLVGRGVNVVATSRRRIESTGSNPTWRQCDVTDAAALERTLEGADVAFYLVHGVGAGHTDLIREERRVAARFARVAEKAGVGRIVYLGATAPVRQPSDHLKGRLDVGEILRASSVPTIELRSSIVVGYGSASWKITEDLALGLPPVAVIPTWMMTRAAPVAIDDVVAALVAAMDLEIEENTWFDIPGTELLTGWQILRRVAKQRGRRLYGVVVPFVTPALASRVIPLWTEATAGDLRDLVPGFQEDLIPHDDRYWSLIGHDCIGFDEAVRRAFAR